MLSSGLTYFLNAEYSSAAQASMDRHMRKNVCFWSQ
jgi:hypothetical protein